MSGSAAPFEKRAYGRGWLYQVRTVKELPGSQVESAFEQLAAQEAGVVEPNGLARGRTLCISASDGVGIRLRLYRRGGLLQRCNRMTFLGLGSSKDRLARELDILCYLQEQGMPVTEPRGGYLRYYFGIWYRCMLATTDIPNADTLLSCWRASAISNEEIRTTAAKLGALVKRLLELGVWHRDLHPANVLKVNGGSLVLLDFDKAERFSPAEEREVYRHYLSRWKRACDKHLLAERRPPAIEGFHKGLLQ